MSGIGGLYAESACPVCGRATFRYGTTYTLGRRGAVPVRQWDRWRHRDDRSLECQIAGDSVAGKGNEPVNGE